MRKYHIMLLLLAVVYNGYAQTDKEKDKPLKCDRPIIITRDLKNQTACIGGAASFIASGNSVGGGWEYSPDNGNTWNTIRTFQFYGSWFDTLYIPSLNESVNNYQYRFYLSNECGSPKYSSVAVLNVAYTPLQFISQPADVKVCVNDIVAQFEIVASGSSLSYQWEKSEPGTNSFTNMPGETGPSILLMYVDSTWNQSRYRCKVTSTCPGNIQTITSTAAILTVNTSSTSITINPNNQLICKGAEALFNAEATGDNITYQWQKAAIGTINYSDISNANSSTLIVPFDPQQTQDIYYRCKIESNCAARHTSNAILHYLSDTPLQIQKPSIVKGACTIGDSAGISIYVVSDGNNCTYQWQKYIDESGGFADIPNAIALTYYFIPSSPADYNTIYRCKVTNSCNVSSFSDTCKIPQDFTYPLSIVLQPKAVNAIAGGSAVFSVSVKGYVKSYNWQGSPDGISFSYLPYGNMPSYSPPNISNEYDNSLFRCVIEDWCGNIIYSDTARLNITLYWTGDGGSPDWNDPSNWSGGQVPIASSNVYIPSGRPRYPVVYTQATCKTLVISKETSVKINTGANLTVTGK